MMKCGAVITINGKLYRIIETRGADSVLIELGIEKYNFEILPVSQLISTMNAKEVDDPYIHNNAPLSDDELNKIKEKQEAIQKILRSLPDITDLATKRRCDVLDRYCVSINDSKSTVHRAIRRYLQSGMDMYSLRDGRKMKKSSGWDMFDGKQRGGHLFYDGTARVMIDPEFEKKIFEEGFRMIGRENSLSYIVRTLNRKYFSEIILDEDGNYVDIIPAPINECISEKRFRRYVKIMLGSDSLEKYKKDARKRRNDDRLRYGTSETNCHYPGAILEIDACELDMIVVGKNKRQDLGRPVVYFAIDVYSRRILAYYIGFENNSFLGATNLFNVLFFEEGVIPDKIRVDHGAEWISKDMRLMGKELGITIEIVAPGTGSLKGLVEDLFHVYQKRIRSSGKKYGAIYKEYSSRHYDKASMMHMELAQDIDAFVETFNHKLLESYELSLDMALKNIRAVPVELWKYGVEHMSFPRHVSPSMREKLIFSMCVSKSMSTEHSLSKKGIMVSQLIYMSKDERVIDLIKRKENKLDMPSYEVRIDPRTVSYVWLRIDSDYLKVPISEKHDNLVTFSHLTWFEYELILKDIKDNKYSYREENRRLQMGLEEQSERIMKKSKKEQDAVGGKNSKKGIREARSQAQQDDRRQNVLGGKTVEDMSSIPKLPSPEEHVTVQELTAPWYTKQGLSEEEPAWESYEEDENMRYEDYF